MEYRHICVVPSSPGTAVTKINKRNNLFIYTKEAHSSVIAVASFFYIIQVSTYVRAFNRARTRDLWNRRRFTSLLKVTTPLHLSCMQSNGIIKAIYNRLLIDRNCRRVVFVESNKNVDPNFFNNDCTNITDRCSLFV